MPESTVGTKAFAGLLFPALVGIAQIAVYPEEYGWQVQALFVPGVILGSAFGFSLQLAEEGGRQDKALYLPLLYLAALLVSTPYIQRIYASYDELRVQDFSKLATINQNIFDTKKLLQRTRARQTDFRNEATRAWDTSIQNPDLLLRSSSDTPPLSGPLAASLASLSTTASANSVSNPDSVSTPAAVRAHLDRIERLDLAADRFERELATLRDARDRVRTRAAKSINTYCIALMVVSALLTIPLLIFAKQPAGDTQ